LLLRDEYLESPGGENTTCYPCIDGIAVLINEDISVVDIDDGVTWNITMSRG